MSDKEINPYDWYKNFFESNLKDGKNFMHFFTTDLYKEFNQMREEMEKIYNQFNDVGYNPPKELVREYEKEDGSKVREVGPIVYGYSITIGPDGNPHIIEFGNIKKSKSSQQDGSRDQLDLGISPRIRGEREPLVDIIRLTRK